MQFGLCNAHAIFKRLIEIILSYRIGVDVLVYLDDVLMFASDAAVLVNTIC